VPKSAGRSQNLIDARKKTARKKRREAPQRELASEAGALDAQSPQENYRDCAAAWVDVNVDVEEGMKGGVREEWSNFSREESLSMSFVCVLCELCEVRRKPLDAKTSPMSPSWKAPTYRRTLAAAAAPLPCPCDQRRLQK
jgi:hypothetical protein